MGRELKRVALDFSWPFNKIWEGYINPYYKQRIPCHHCDESGSNLEARILYKLEYAHLQSEVRELLPRTNSEPLRKFAISLLNKRSLSTMFFNWAKGNVSQDTLNALEALRDKVFDSEEELYIEITPLVDSWELKQLKYYIKNCTPVGWSAALDEQDVEVLLKEGSFHDFYPNNFWYHFKEETQQWEYLNRNLPYEERKWTPCEKPESPTVDEARKYFIRGFHGSITYRCAREKAKREDIPAGECEHCKGNGYTWPEEDMEEKYENWKKEEPPTGEGFQLWETTSEGSPISPVFNTLDKLCEYAEENCSTFADSKTSKENWKKMLEDDFVFTPMLDENGNQTGAVFI